MPKRGIKDLSCAGERARSRFPPSLVVGDLNKESLERHLVKTYGTACPGLFEPGRSSFSAGVGSVSLRLRGH